MERYDFPKREMSEECYDKSNFNNSCHANGFNEEVLKGDAMELRTIVILIIGIPRCTKAFFKEIGDIREGKIDLGVNPIRGYFWYQLKNLICAVILIILWIILLYIIAIFIIWVIVNNL